MPAPGHQHQNVTNPFLDEQPRIARWAAEEIATISARLDKQLGPEYISSRAGPGGTRVHYLTAEKCITLANEVFGFNGWSSSIQNIQVDFADENPQTQRISLGLSVIVRVTLRDGTFHEDIGYGSIENAKGKAMAFEKAKKEGTTDGLKRALRNFGNVLGNCIYDKEYIGQVTKIKPQPAKKFDPSNLHRRSEPGSDTLSRTTTGPVAAPGQTAGGGAVGGPIHALKTEVSESFDDFLGELDEADFCVTEDGHPDEIIVPDVPPNNRSFPRPAQQTTRSNSTMQSAVANPQTPNSHQRSKGLDTAQTTRTQQTTPAQQSDMPPPHVSSFHGNGPAPDFEPTFFSAKAALADSSASGQASAPARNPQVQLFNPKSESPSIRKTPGIDHSSSKPLARNGQHVPPAASQQQQQQGPAVPSAGNTSSYTPVRPAARDPAPQKGNITNPSLDHARRIGAPARPNSPLANRGSYKPPSMKRNLPEGVGPQPNRTPLADLPTGENGHATVKGLDGTEVKRQRMT